MKFTLHRLKIGDVVRAQIVELFADGECIVSFQGDLIRLRNESVAKLQLSDKILVRVIATRPLLFQMLQVSDREQKPTRLNINI